MRTLRRESRDIIVLRRIRHLIEYMLLRFFGFLFVALPYRVGLFIVWVAAALMFFVFRFRAVEACRRIEQVFPDTYGPAERRRIAWCSWRDFAFSIVDMFRLHKIDEKWMRRHIVDFEKTREEIRNSCLTGGGAVFAAPHMGATEVGSVTVQRCGAPIFLIIGKQKNPYVDRFLEVLRGQTGIPTVQRGSSLLKSVIARLREGQVLAFLPDLRVAPGGNIINFLGFQASVAPGMARFARQTGVPILPVIARRDGWTKHSIEIKNPVRPDAEVAKAQDCLRMTQDVFDVIDHEVRQTPEQYFWFNKRWILDPP